MTKIQRYAGLGLIFSLLGYIPKIGYIFSIVGVIACALVYREWAQAKLSQSATKLYLAITILSLIALIMALWGWTYGQLVGGVIAILAYALGIFVAWLTYLLHLEVRKVALWRHDKLLKIAALMLKVAAFTMPLLIGFLLQALTQLIILIAMLRHQRPTGPGDPVRPGDSVTR